MTLGPEALNVRLEVKSEGGNEVMLGTVLLRSDTVATMGATDVVPAVSVHEVTLGDSAVSESASLSEDRIIGLVVCLVLSLVEVLASSCSDIVVPGTTT